MCGREQRETRPSNQFCLPHGFADASFDRSADERRRQEKYKTNDGFVVDSDDEDEGELDNCVPTFHRNITLN